MKKESISQKFTEQKLDNFILTRPVFFTNAIIYYMTHPVHYRNKRVYILYLTIIFPQNFCIMNLKSNALLTVMNS